MTITLVEKLNELWRAETVQVAKCLAARIAEDRKHGEAEIAENDWRGKDETATAAPRTEAENPHWAAEIAKDDYLDRRGIRTYRNEVGMLRIDNGTIELALGTGWWCSLNAETWTVEPVPRAADPLWHYGHVEPEWAEQMVRIRETVLVQQMRDILNKIRDGQLDITGCPHKDGSIGDRGDIPYRRLESRHWTLSHDGLISFRRPPQEFEDIRIIEITAPASASDGSEYAAQHYETSGGAGRPSSMHLVELHLKDREVKNETHCTAQKKVIT